MLDSNVQSFLLQAASKALATSSLDQVLNVVPVSSIRIKDGSIVLVNYFMDKTLANIQSNPYVALVAWSKMIGYQVKGTAAYYTGGELFDEIVQWVKDTIPDRTVRGIIVITPTALYDIAPGKNTAEVFSKE